MILNNQITVFSLYGAGIEPTSSCILSQCSTTESRPWPPGPLISSLPGIFLHGTLCLGRRKHLVFSTSYLAVASGGYLEQTFLTSQDFNFLFNPVFYIDFRSHINKLLGLAFMC